MFRSQTCRRNWPGFTIVQLSDIPVGPTIKRDYLQAILDRVNQLDADLVAIPGDVVDGSVEQLRAHVAPLGDLRSRHGSHVVTGNHEYYSGAAAWIREFERIGLRGLHNRHTVIAHRGARFVLVGVTDFSAGAFAAAQAMKRLGIEMIAAYSPEARGRSERMFRTHQDRLPRELALAGITRMADANRYLAQVYRPAFDAEFLQPAMEERSAFVGWISGALDDILCERFERTVGNDNCVRFEGMRLQIPADRHRCHYVKAKVAVLRRTDNTLAILHGPRNLADYDQAGQVIPLGMKAAA